jgi:hypothetical protein
MTNGYFAALDEAEAYLAALGFLPLGSIWVQREGGHRAATITPVGNSHLVEFGEGA